MQEIRSSASTHRPLTKIEWSIVPEMRDNPSAKPAPCFVTAPRFLVHNGMEIRIPKDKDSPSISAFALAEIAPDRKEQIPARDGKYVQGVLSCQHVYGRDLGQKQCPRCNESTKR
jgi:hypothetical protein